MHKYANEISHFIPSKVISYTRLFSSDFVWKLKEELYNFSDRTWGISSCISIDLSPTDFMKRFRKTDLPDELSVTCPRNFAKHAIDDNFPLLLHIPLNTVHMHDHLWLSHTTID